MVLGNRAVDLPAGRLTTACSCRDPAGIVLQNGGVSATLGSGRLRAPRPAGLRHGGGALQLKLSPLDVRSFWVLWSATRVAFGRSCGDRLSGDDLHRFRGAARGV